MLVIALCLKYMRAMEAMPEYSPLCDFCPIMSEVSTIEGSTSKKETEISPSRRSESFSDVIVTFPLVKL